jgi:hypothetical protein
MGTMTELHGRRLGLTQDNRIGAPGQPYKVTMSAATNGSNKSLVTLTVVDNEDKAVAACHVMHLILSDAATGKGLTGTTASGNVQAGSKGTDLQAITAKKHLLVQTDETGVYILDITDSAKVQAYVCCVVAGSTPFLVAGRILTANYG